MPRSSSNQCLLSLLMGLKYFSIILNGSVQISEKKVTPSVYYKVLRLFYSLWPRLYNLFKTHKYDMPGRPILSMIGSVQHNLTL